MSVTPIATAGGHAASSSGPAEQAGGESVDAPPAAGLALALVNMPFASHRRPSLQLGLLGAIARDAGHRAEIFHLNLDFAAVLGEELYDLLCEHRGTALGEWVFAEAAFGAETPDAEGLLPLRLNAGQQSKLARVCGDRSPLEWLRHLRRVVAPAFVEGLAVATDWSRFRVVGFTSTFQQNAASLALASRIKRDHPAVITLFGGANLDGPMGREFVAAFDAVDYALSGEADHSFPMLLDRIADGRSLDDVPGLLRRREGRVRANAPAPQVRGLDDLPIPDYDDYFARAERLGLIRADAARRNIDLPFESARGCWWGAKHHCTFCGLNGQTMAFRAKSAERVVRELGELARRYRSYRFEAVDNIIEPTYLRTLVPELSRLGTTYDIFYEVKANLDRDAVAALSAAGIRRIQPGIESLSSNVLRLMRKGVRAADNVNLLRWAAYYGVSVSWNLLWGFPGESPEDYAEQAALIPLLTHLQAPGGAGRLWMERFSPLFTDRAAFPARFLTPEASLSLVYPEHVKLDRLAYFFDYELENTPGPETYEAVIEAVQRWLTPPDPDQPPPRLEFYHSPGLVHVVDTRDPKDESTYTLEGPLASLHMACNERPRGLKAAARAAGLGPDQAESVLNRLCGLGLMMRDGDRYLALAIPAGRSTG
ncbi:RiPP maturation radical SAM C-methyltransferase [Embleya sp. NPDC001921]